VAAASFANKCMLISTQGDWDDAPALIDIAYGAAGSEQIIVSDLISMGNGYGDAFPGSWLLHVDIPAGARIAARAQTPSGLLGVYVSIGCGSTDFRDKRAVGLYTTYGADTATSLGVNVDPGPNAYTFSPWVEVTPATVEDHYGLVVALFSNQSEIVYDRSFRAQIAAGPTGSEDVIVNELLVGSSRQGDRFGKNWHIPVAIPGGTRLSIRAEVNSSEDGDRDLYAILYGLR
jgi:hypothetical protein